MYTNMVSWRFIALAGIAILLPACWSKEHPVQAAKKTGLVVINVLEKSWYDDCHIKGSISVPLEELDIFVKDLDPEKAEIVLYCSNYFCSSSGYACKRLKGMGFKQVWAYEGGTAEWYQMGLPVEGPSARPYLAKKITPLLHQDDDIPVISAQELAQKLSQ